MVGKHHCVPPKVYYSLVLVALKEIKFPDIIQQKQHPLHLNLKTGGREQNGDHTKRGSASMMYPHFLHVRIISDW